METTRLLADRLADLLRRERGALSEFLLALADFDRERRWEELGYATLFDFLHRHLRLSRGAAYYRSTAARLVQEHGEVADALRDGRLCLMTVGELAKVLTRENVAEVLPRFFGASKREAQAIVAELQPAPAPPTREVVTVLAAAPVPAVAQPPSAGLPGSTATPPPAQPSVEHVGERAHDLPKGTDRSAVGDERGVPETAGSGTPHTVRIVLPVELEARSDCASPAPTSPSSPAPAVTRPRDEVVPLTADLRRLHVTVSRAFLVKLDAARDALSHARPGATTEDVLGAALDLLLAARDRRRGVVAKPRGATTKPGAPAVALGPPSPAHSVSSPVSTRAPIAARVRREVWKRDGGCCQWVLDSGEICGSRKRIEFDHIVPQAQGGPSTVANLRLLCKPHNLIAAKRAYGEAWMDRFLGAKEPEAPYGPETLWAASRPGDRAAILDL